MQTAGDSRARRRVASSEELREQSLTERLRGPCILIRAPDGRQGLHTLHPGITRVTIGRGPGNDIALPGDADLSRLHAELECHGGGWSVVDEGSRTGTWVNGRRITGRVRLRDGDVMQVGTTLLALRLPRSRSRASRLTAAAGPAPGVPSLTAAQKRVLEALCRPYEESQFATPATDQQIAEELFLSADAVQAHVRGLCAAFGMDGRSRGQERSALAKRAIELGLVR